MLQKNNKQQPQQNIPIARKKNQRCQLFDAWTSWVHMVPTFIALYISMFSLGFRIKSSTQTVALEFQNKTLIKTLSVKKKCATNSTIYSCSIRTHALTKKKQRRCFAHFAESTGIFFPSACLQSIQINILNMDLCSSLRSCICICIYNDYLITGWVISYFLFI